MNQSGEAMDDPDVLRVVHHSRDECLTVFAGSRGRDMNDNLKSAYPGAIEGWEGCYDKDCLPDCDLRKNHCERLELFLELRRVAEEEAKWIP